MKDVPCLYKQNEPFKYAHSLMQAVCVALKSSSSSVLSRSGDDCFPNNRPAALTPPDFLWHFLMPTSRTTDSQAVMFWDTYSPNQHCGYIWHVESCGLNNFLLCVLLWTRVIGTCQQDYLWLNHSALHLQDGGNRVGERVKLFLFFVRPLCVCASVSILFPFSWCRLSRPALHLAPLGLW